jgi:hypothetical protein
MDKMIVTALVVLAVVPVLVSAGNFDGSKPLLCASTEVIECLPGQECLRVTPEAIDAPQFIRVDMKAKTLTTTVAADAGKISAIERSEVVDGKLMIQGAEDGSPEVRDGVGWTLAISQTSGKLVVTASGDDVAFVIFGACTPL